MRTLLLLTQTFPPFGGAGNRRVAKLVKHLAHLGWRSVVVTSRRVLKNMRDDTLLEDIPPGTKVLRTPTLEPLVTWGAHPSSLLALRRALNVPLVPSVGMLWAAPALPCALRAARRERVDVIVSSGPDFSSHVLAATLRVMTGVPVILDYRDEWTTHPERLERVGRHWWLSAKNDLDRALERRCLRLADRVVLNTPGFVRPFVSALGCAPTKLSVVSNGFDLDELPPHEPRPGRDRPFTLIHVGAINRESQVRADFFAMLRDRAAAARRELRLVLVGDVAPALAKRLDGESAGPLRVERVGFLPAREALASLQHADAALLLQESTPGSERYQNLKLFDYLGADIPILALAPDPGEIARVIRECRAGVVADPSRPWELAETVDRWLREGAPRPALTGARDNYSWPALALRWRAILEEVTTRAGAPEAMA